MRRHIFGCVVMLMVCLAGHSPACAKEDPLAGHWEGAFVRLNSIQTVGLDITTEGGGARGTYDIPDLGLYGEPLTEVASAPAEAASTPPTFSFKLLYGVFSMHVHGDIAEMTGANGAWDPPVALHLKRVPQASPTMVREEVRFRNGPVSLAGTLLKPRTPGPHPAIVLVHGSGAQGRKVWAYRSLGEIFARRGIAALVYDKRGVGASTGDAEASSFEDLAGDAAAAFELLAHRSDIDRNRIGMLGSSQGGWLAPLAASRLRKVAFLILNKGAAVDVEEQEVERVEYGMRSEGKFSEPDIAAALAYTRLVFRVAASGADGSGDGWPELQAATARARGARWADQVQLAESEKDVAGWRIQRFDPAPILKRTRVPVLALFGEKDTFVPPAENADLMRAYLREAGNTDVTIVVIPGLGHSSFAGQSLRGGDWHWPYGYWVWDKQSPAFMETVMGWLSAHLGPGQTER